jgi:hypothetical protein
MLFLHAAGSCWQPTSDDCEHYFHLLEAVTSLSWHRDGRCAYAACLLAVLVVACCRFVPTLRSDGVDVVLGVFKALCILGGERQAARCSASAA